MSCAFSVVPEHNPENPCLISGSEERNDNKMYDVYNWDLLETRSSRVLVIAGTNQIADISKIATVGIIAANVKVLGTVYMKS